MNWPRRLHNDPHDSTSWYFLSQVNDTSGHQLSDFESRRRHMCYVDLCSPWRVLTKITSTRYYFKTTLWWFHAKNRLYPSCFVEEASPCALIRFFHPSTPLLLVPSRFFLVFTCLFYRHLKNSFIPTFTLFYQSLNSPWTY